MAKTVIYLVRHGESIGNKMKIALGHTDLPLTELGVEQAEMTAKSLKDVVFDVIYSSDLKRAMQTAEPHARLRGMKVIGVEGLREMFCGEWENQPMETVIERDPEAFYVHWRKIFGNFQMPGGESVPEAAERFYVTLRSIAEKHPGQTLLIASHAAVIRGTWGHKILGLKGEEIGSKLPFPSNASYSVLEYENGKFTPVSYSNDEHLRAAGICTEIK